MRIAYCTPFGAVSSPEHTRAKAIVQNTLLQHTFLNAEIDLHVVSKARNALVQIAQDQVDVLWFVDSDIRLPENAGKLLGYLNKSPVVSGLYFSRRPPYFPQVYNRALPALPAHAYLPRVAIPLEPFHADAVGAGCLLVTCDVLRQLHDAHEEWRGGVRAWMGDKRRRMPAAVKRAIELGLGLNGHFEFLECVGEDFYFCEMLWHYLRIRPLVVPEVLAGHEAVIPITNEHFSAYLERGLSFNSSFPEGGGIR